MINEVLSNGKNISNEQIISLGVQHFVDHKGDFELFQKYLCRQDLKDLPTEYLQHCLKIFSSYTIHPLTRASATADILVITNELNSRDSWFLSKVTIGISVSALIVAVFSFISSHESSKLTEKSIELMKKEIEREAHSEKNNTNEILKTNKHLEKISTSLDKFKQSFESRSNLKNEE